MIERRLAGIEVARYGLTTGCNEQLRKLQIRGVREKVQMQLSVRAGRYLHASLRDSYVTRHLSGILN